MPDKVYGAAPVEPSGLRSMREAMRESADILQSAAGEHDDHADVDLGRLYRIQDLQAELFRVRAVLKDVERMCDENFFRVVDLQHQSRDQESRIEFLLRELEAAHARDAAQQARESAQQARHEAIDQARRAELAHWQSYAGGLRGVVEDLLSSDSWRLTWVLRAMSATLSRRKSTGPTLPDAPPPPSLGHDGG